MSKRRQRRFRAQKERTPVTDNVLQLPGPTAPAPANDPSPVKFNNPNARGRRVSVCRDTALTFPELWMDIYIEGDHVEQRAFMEMFLRSRCRKADSPENADLVIFTGGPDVDPLLYGETPHESTHISPSRDQSDMEMYKLCYEKGIPMLGVCRGAQFLHVMNGGKLYQDIDNHHGDHTIWDFRLKTQLPCVSSVHHQACISNLRGGMEVVADSIKAKKRWLNNKDKADGPFGDVEAFWYRSTCCFGIQGHPEYRGYYHFMQWSLKKIEDYIVNNPDLEMIDHVRRLKPELLAKRMVADAKTSKGADGVTVN